MAKVDTFAVMRRVIPINWPYLVYKSRCLWQA